MAATRSDVPPEGQASSKRLERNRPGAQATCNDRLARLGRRQHAPGGIALSFTLVQLRNQLSPWALLPAARPEKVRPGLQQGNDQARVEHEVEQRGKLSIPTIQQIEQLLRLQ